jgi:superfamily II DNA or RNA helicase
MSQRRQLLANASNKLEVCSTLAPALLETEHSIVFTEAQSAAVEVARLLRSAGVSAKNMDSTLSRAERTKRLSQLRQNKLHTLVAPRILDEGVDVPNVDAGVIVSASRSRRQMIQRLGRIVRPNKDGRASVFFIIYLADTSEDPAGGAHEGFLEEVQPHAAEVAHFDLRHHDAQDLARWVSTR